MGFCVSEPSSKSRFSDRVHGTCRLAPKTERVTLVCDNVNSHDTASLYAETAHRLTKRLRIVPTPRNNGWLNMGAMEP